MNNIHSLHDAAWERELERVKALLKDNHDLVLSKDHNGATPLHVAAANGYKDVAELLLAYQAELNAKDIIGRTPLHVAMAAGRKDVPELLLANQADVNARDYLGQTPLHMAALGGYKDVADLLLANQAEVNARDHLGQTPLHMALGNRAVAAVLRQHCGHK